MNPVSKTILTVIVTAIIVGGGTYYFVNNKAENDKTALQNSINDLNKKTADSKESVVTPTASATPTPSPATSADPTSGWNTYTNSSLGFSLKYPSSYTTTDKLQTNGSSAAATQSLTIKDANAAGSPTLEIYVNPAGFDGPPTNLLYTFSKSGTSLKIDSKAKQAVAIGDFGYDGTTQIAGTRLSGQKLGDTTYIIRFHYKTGSDGLLTTFDEMINSFKFTQ